MPLSYLTSPWTDSTRRQSTSGDNVPTLDGVRGLAVLIVLLSHCGVPGMRGQGGLGVLLFFVLSGYVLSIPVVKNPPLAYSPAFIARFAVNRILRIYPAFVVAVAVVWLSSGSWP